jgi:hypothetical protein
MQQFVRILCNGEILNVGEEKYWRIFWEILIKADGPRGCGRPGDMEPRRRLGGGVACRPPADVSVAQSVAAQEQCFKCFYESKEKLN